MPREWGKSEVAYLQALATNSVRLFARLNWQGYILEQFEAVYTDRTKRGIQSHYHDLVRYGSIENAVTMYRRGKIDSSEEAKMTARKQIQHAKEVAKRERDAKEVAKRERDASCPPTGSAPPPASTAADVGEDPMGGLPFMRSRPLRMMGQKHFPVQSVQLAQYRTHQALRKLLISDEELAALDRERAARNAERVIDEALRYADMDEDRRSCIEIFSNEVMTSEKKRQRTSLICDGNDEPLVSKKCRLVCLLEHGSRPGMSQDCLELQKLLDSPSPLCFGNPELREFVTGSEEPGEPACVE